MAACECGEIHERRRVVLTGGPGAGKTALLELIRQSFCSHVKVLPEAARGLWRGLSAEDDPACRRAAQRRSSMSSASWRAPGTATIRRLSFVIVAPSMASPIGQARLRSSGPPSEPLLIANSADTMPSFICARRL